MIDLNTAAVNYANDPTPENLAVAVQAGAPYVNAMAQRVSLPATCTVVDRDDLVSGGTIGLINALSKYDPESGTVFASYAYAHVYGAANEVLSSTDSVLRHTRNKIGKAMKAAMKLEQRLGRQPSETEAAEAAGVSVERYRDLFRWARSRFTASIGGGDYEENKEVFNPVTYTPDPLDVDRLLSTLDDRSAEIVRAYFFEDRDQKEIAASYDVTQSLVSKILKGAYGQMRLMLDEDVLLDA